jgi:hypothetical protein
VPQDAEARQDLEAKDEQHAEELGKLREAKVSGDLFFVCGCT